MVWRHRRCWRSRESEDGKGAKLFQRASDTPRGRKFFSSLISAMASVCVVARRGLSHGCPQGMHTDAQIAKRVAYAPLFALAELFLCLF